MKFLFLFLSFFILINTNLFAQANPDRRPVNGSGCFFNNRIYYTYVRTIYQSGSPSLSSNYRYQYNSSNFHSYTSCPNVENKFYVRGNVAYQNGPGGGSTDVGCGISNIYNSNGGTMYFFQVYNCPIDDYIPYALVSIGGFGFMYIRRRQIIL